MAKFIITLTIGILFSLAGLAQSNGDIQGRIIDAKTGLPLAYAKIKFQSNYSKVATMSGMFQLNDLLPGMYEIEVSYPGYATQIVKNIEVQRNSVTLLNIGMSAQLNPDTLLLYLPSHADPVLPTL
ncbi:MAG: carboxypeptidase regulatory-like domain-containing protein [Sphingobacteriales bacterium]|jgi:hypothetical protein|nr:carboxypeptidase regulatory-like domain-containing protein [Sphingobacteriales bacterium]MBP9140353.1 carboxypeptidase regulatory-like domain-containing protein [Chitinophagales bacterium]MDA0199578.1 carboxypeptidase-like regulatory domain-containing protein [Bacteroidota bacterium]MBK6890041.1 carboxypeptidase regulatory-like domain-containing protein [Sphingobacteriales bacterium]MBK7527433.1 carboxypeptidase regulatory-like domain-containing protein [Sphingobacteriales bacterium]